MGSEFVDDDLDLLQIGGYLYWELPRYPDIQQVSYYQIFLTAPPYMYLYAIFWKFSWIFQSFRKFFEVFGHVRTRSDLFRGIRMHVDAFGSVRTFLEKFEIRSVFRFFLNTFSLNL